MKTRITLIAGLLLLSPLLLAGCGNPAVIEGKVTITSTAPFSQMKVSKSKQLGHKPSS